MILGTKERTELGYFIAILVLVVALLVGALIFTTSAPVMMDGGESPTYAVGREIAQENREDQGQEVLESSSGQESATDAEIKERADEERVRAILNKLIQDSLADTGGGAFPPLFPHGTRVCDVEVLQSEKLVPDSTERAKKVVVVFSREFLSEGVGVAQIDDMVWAVVHALGEMPEILDFVTRVEGTDGVVRDLNDYIKIPAEKKPKDRTPDAPLDGR